MEDFGGGLWQKTLVEDLTARGAKAGSGEVPPSPETINQIAASPFQRYGARQLSLLKNRQSAGRHAVGFCFCFVPTREYKK